MDIFEYLVPGGIVILKSEKKDLAVRELVDAVCAGNRSLDPAVVLPAVLERETMVSTWIAPGIAIPHARLPGLREFSVGIGVSIDGIEYDSVDGKPVHLLILVLGDEGKPDEHILLLAEIAKLLKDPEVCDGLLSAKSVDAVLKAIGGTRIAAGAGLWKAGNEVSGMIMNAALTIAKEVRAQAILVQTDATVERDWLSGNVPPARIILARSQTVDVPADPRCRTLSVPFRGLSRSERADVALLFGVAEGLFDRRDTVVSVSGSPGSDTLDMLRVVNVGEEFSPYLSDSSPAILGDVMPQVVERTIQIAMDIAHEGREGRRVGTIFVLGDYEHVNKYCRQMVINPFRGYGDDEKSIIDPSLEETIKEFAAIDGAFVVRGDGVVMAAGAYLRHGRAAAELPSGLGARHRAAAGISAVTAATSIAVSQSTGTVSVYRSGKRILALEKSGR